MSVQLICAICVTFVASTQVSLLASVLDTSRFCVSICVTGLRHSAQDGTHTAFTVPLAYRAVVWGPQLQHFEPFTKQLFHPSLSLWISIHKEILALDAPAICPFNSPTTTRIRNSADTRLTFRRCRRSRPRTLTGGGCVESNTTFCRRGGGMSQGKV